MADERRDRALLLDMLAYAGEARWVLGSRSYETFLKDRLRVLALERALEVVGEAARNVSPERKAATADIPWNLIAGQRNVLAHQYGKIDHFQVFRTASEDIPRLIEVLRRILG
ncbi:MAG: HepT-like ribonuclease domain-containing protein [Burkholderiales bacterium]